MHNSNLSWVKTKEQRPEDGQKIIYFFEPFGSLNIGTYISDSDSVYGKSGFTSMCPEVPCWASYDDVVSAIDDSHKKFD